MALLIEYNGIRPTIADGVFLAENATIIGDVTIGAEANIWYGVVIRGDSGKIVIGKRTSVQDNTVVHVNPINDTIIDNDVTIGHGAILEGCHVGNEAVIGMNATVLDGVTIGERSIVAAGAVVREGSSVPSGVIVAGIPAKVKREISMETEGFLFGAPKRYLKYAKAHKEAKIIRS